MRALAAGLLVGALLLGAARLFTGVVYGADSPVAYLVLKSAPDFRVERPEASGSALGHEIVLDAEESQLAYGWAYLGLMRAVPVLATLMVGLAAVLVATSGRQRRRRRRRA